MEKKRILKSKVMKDAIIFGVLMTALVTTVFYVGMIFGKTEAVKEQTTNNEIHFIWNDDEESIPKDGSTIVIEFTDENKVYIGTVEAND